MHAADRFTPICTVNSDAPADERAPDHAESLPLRNRGMKRIRDDSRPVLGLWSSGEGTETSGELTARSLTSDAWDAFAERHTAVWGPPWSRRPDTERDSDGSSRSHRVPASG